MVERLTSALQALFPLVVALALRQAARDEGNQRQRCQERLKALASGRAQLAAARELRGRARLAIPKTAAHLREKRLCIKSPGILRSQHPGAL